MARNHKFKCHQDVTLTGSNLASLNIITDTYTHNQL